MPSKVTSLLSKGVRAELSCFSVQSYAYCKVKGYIDAGVTKMATTKSSQSSGRDKTLGKHSNYNLFQ